MSGPTDWLPALITMGEFDGDWERFDRAVYAAFREDWLGARPAVFGKRMGLKAYPLQQGKEATYYHLTHEGADENARQPDLRRMERIRWPRAMVEAIGTVSVLVWRNERRTKGGPQQRILIALPDFSYVVVLSERDDYVLPWTAYTVERPHQRAKLRGEYERST